MSSNSLRKNPRIMACMALLIAAAVAVGCWQTGAIGQEGGKPQIQQKAVDHATALSTAFRKAAEVTMPTVVTIRSKTKAQTVRAPRMPRGNNGENPFKGTPFEDFFNENGGMEGMPAPSQRREGTGSGVIIDKSGIVLTNNHVVEGADEVIVRLADGREYKAEDIKTDDQTDLAVLRIKGAGDLPFAKMGDSDKMEIGDWVIAIGNPFELEQTVSAGIISGKGRELGSIRRAKFLQTDAAINPGNSGGPLVNLEGEVVGINTAIATNNGAFQGIGFAVPINLAKWVTTQLIQTGNVQRAYLGVAIGEVDGDLAGKFGLKRGDGVIVSEVFTGSPAADAGFQEGDVITAFGGHKVHNPRELQELVERAPLDSKNPVSIVRDSKPMTLTVVAKALPKKFGIVEAKRNAPEEEKSSTSNFKSDNLGMTVGEASADELSTLGLAGFQGVLITGVEADGLAAEHGLAQGMLVMKVDKKPVHTVAEFKAAVEGQNLKDGILLLVRTRGGNRFVVLQQS